MIMVVCSLQKPSSYTKKEEESQAIELLAGDGITDLTLTVPEVILYMHENAPAYYPLPLESTLRGFTVKLVEELGSDRYKADEAFSHLEELQKNPELKTAELTDIRKKRGFRQISSLYNTLSFRIQSIGIYYPSLDKLPEDVREQREKKALEKTFCKK